MSHVEFKNGSCHLTSFFPISIGFMSHVDFKQRPSRHVALSNLRVKGPNEGRRDGRTDGGEGGVGAGRDSVVNLKEEHNLSFSIITGGLVVKRGFPAL